MNRRDEFSPRRLLARLASVASVAAVVAAAAVLFSDAAGVRAQAPGPCEPPNGNPVVCENQKAGNPSSEWDIGGAGDDSIQGFTTDISVNRGQTVSFKIKSTTGNYRLDIYRMGYYSGMGARKVATINRAGAVQTQSPCLSDAITGLVDCGSWAVSTSWLVPADAVSGIYFAKLVRADDGGASHILFVVRDDASTSDVLFQTSDTTWQAYNRYGGNSLYAGGPATSPNRAYKVSYNRPFTTRDTAPEDWVFNAEYPMVRWLEANGYNVAYSAGIDTDRAGSARIRQHKLFMSVGHDEYWSGAQRANVEAARAAGVHLAFFSGNEVFWKTRYESSISSPATAYRTLVSYKETHAGAKIDPQANIWTGAWEDPRFSPPSDGGRPSNALTGTLFRVNAGTTAIKVPAADGKMRFWRNTSVASLAPNAVATLAPETLGYEWDEDVANAFRPAGLIRLSDTTVNDIDRLQDYGSLYGIGSANHALTLYRHPSGALVFGAGTVQWSWGLDDNHERGSGGGASLEMQQATLNLFADMDVQPLTIQSGLFSASKSSDAGAPASSISFPAAGTQPANSTVTITGTAADNGGGQVGGVEVSVDNGLSWKRAIGRANWSYSWQTGAPRTVTLLSRAADDSGNIEVPVSGTTVTLGSIAPVCPCSLWSAGQTPASGAQQDANAVELGTRFRSDIAGYITAIRFYKNGQDVGPHLGNLWSEGGARLATVVFSAETASGWQQAPLDTPVAITANTTYVVSYHTDSGFYSADEQYFAANGVDNGPLHAPQDTDAAANGLYRYGASGVPTGTYRSGNYWADVVFQTTVAPDTTGPMVGATTPLSGATAVALSTAVTAEFNEAMAATSISGTTVELRGASGVLVASTVTYAPSTRTVTLQPSAALASSATYTATVKGGSTGVKDVAGNPLAGNFSWSFSTAGAPPPPPTSGPGGPILVIASSANPFGQYYAEILRAEGLNAFKVMDVTTVTATVLNGFDAVILAEMPLTAAQVTMLSTWVTAGGNLIAMRPDKQLASLLGLTDAAATLADSYLLVNTAAAPGTGIVGETMQFHGIADRYAISDATTIATLYASAAAATTSPAVTVRSVGGAGGQAAAFTYDLAKSIVYTRQGNPAWSQQDRDGYFPIRSDDLFFGGTQADYVDLSKVAIPQADEQQRLLANLIGLMTADRTPLPRFWYLPRGLKAVVVMTGDDHANNGTAGRFDIYNSKSAPGCNVANWDCVRATSYIFPNTPINPSEVAAFTAQGFEIGAHMWMSGLDAGVESGSSTCNDFTTASIAADYPKQLALFGSLFPSALPVRTNRTHCVVWSDYTTQAQVELANGIRLDTNYYYWPGAWVNDVPGLFTGSAMPMRFAKADGTMIDVYQAATQMTDESGQSFPSTVNTLLDRALGPLGYYGAFVANMHTDVPVLAQSEAIVASAQARNVPIISAKQLLTWLDGRNGSTFTNTTWNGTTYGFSVSVAAGANNLQTLLPATMGTKSLTGLTRAGVAVPYVIQTLKGVSYVVFTSTAGAYLAEYTVDATAPIISALAATPALSTATVTWTTNKAATTQIAYGTTASALNLTATVAGLSSDHSVQLTGLTSATPYYYRVTSATAGGATATAPSSPAAPATFTTTTPAALNCPCMIWPTQTPTQPSVQDPSAGELGLKFRPSVDGFVSAIRFYKGQGNLGTHVGNLWTMAGINLGTVVFANETSSGWQQAILMTPVAVSANTTYVVSYHTNTGYYAGDTLFFSNTGVTNGPLEALMNGVNGQNGVYKYGATGFPTSSYNSANYWVDVVFSVTAPGDTTAPTVSSTTPAAGAAGVAAATAVTATFNEDINPATVTAANVELRTAANVLVPGTVSYLPSSRTATLQPTDALAASSTYTARVRSGATGVKDVAGNALAADSSWSFTTAAPAGLSFSDTTSAQFGAGTLDSGTYISQTGDGELLLAPAVASEFSGATMPAGWSTATWNDGGSVVFTGNTVAVDGSRLALDSLLGPGQSLEFVATFSTDVAAHIGFGVTFNDAPWAMFSSGDGTALFARTHDGVTATNTPIAGNWLGTPHRYRIDWTASSVAYFVDGVQVAVHAATIASNLRPMVSDYYVGGTALSVDWVRLTPYAVSGSFTSRVIDGGSNIAWGAASFSTTVPAATTLAMSARFGNTPVPDGSWTAFQPLSVSGAAVAQTSRYVQYRASLSGTGGSTPSLEDVTFTGAIQLASLTINDVSLTEGNSGTQNATFTISLSPAAATAVTVGYSTTNDTAASGSDYTAVSGVVTIAAGSTSATVDVPVSGDLVVEPSETFVLNLSTPTNAVIGDAQGTATIVNDDSASLSIANVSVTEGNGSPVTATFTVTLSAASTQAVTVNYATATGTAGAADFTARSGTLTFAAGVTTQPIAVTTLGDTLDEADETFTVSLSNPVNAGLGVAQATGTIVDNDAAPVLAINNVTVTEGNAGTTNATLTVSLSAASSRIVTVNFGTANATAIAGSDYIATTGTLSFAAGSTSQSIVIPVVGDLIDEAPETFNVNLTGAANASITDSQGVGSITDNDAAPALTINNVSVTEGNSGTRALTFTVTLSAVSGQTVSVRYATANGSATGGTSSGDYVTSTNTLTLAPGTTTATVTISVRGDTSREANETFAVNLTNPVNVTISDAQGIGTILNDD